MMCKTLQRQGFTLLEMSIVLVIIGLIVGGVLVGRDLIRSFEIRRDISMIYEAETAIMVFEQKYNALPGDMPNAFQFFGTEAGCTNQNVNSAVAGCNGDGNGQIGASWPQLREGFRAWQQLGLAGIVSGSYSGVAGPLNSSTDAVIGVNMPATATKGGGIGIRWVQTIISDSWGYAGNYGNVITLGADHAVNFFNIDRLYTPVEALSFDQKIDDGIPGTGRLRAYHPSSGLLCTTSNNPTTSTYRIDLTTAECSFLYLLKH